MPNSRLIALNGNAGAFVDVFATVPATRMRFREDDAAAATGIQVKFLLDAFATTNVYASTSEPVEIPPGQAISTYRKIKNQFRPSEKMTDRAVGSESQFC
jgi:hypothetical protein